MNYRNIFLFIILLISFSLFGQKLQEKRIALVIGNSAYLNGQVLKNPVNDANLMATTLQKLGFSVVKVLNANKMQMENAILSFSRKLSGTNVALLFYAGHGIQVNGVNYLLPTDANVEDQLSVQFQAVDVGKVVSQFEAYPNNINILILDACRNNPFRSWMRSVGNRGFKAIVAPSGTLIAFATSEGSTASDGMGINGLYTQELVKQMLIPQSIETVFKKTRINVERLSSDAQSPQEWTKLKSDFYFNRAIPSEKTDNQVDVVVYESQISIGNGSILLNVPISGKLKIDNLYYDDVTFADTITIRNLSNGIHALEIFGEEYWKKNVTINGEMPVEIGFNNSVKDSGNDTGEIVDYNERFGSIIDTRDGKKYAWVKIKDQIWMAQNLNFASSGSWCYKKNEANCSKYGRLYNGLKIDNVCPEGWHIPITNEWNNMLQFFGYKMNADQNVIKNLENADRSDFALLLSGKRIGDWVGKSFSDLNEVGYYWAFEEYSYGRYQYLKSFKFDKLLNEIRFYSESINEFYPDGYSVRCVKNVAK
jgi:uncharacterized protein (TIGR02145 family)